uniref:Uncharacterized protein n=1 Tax=Arundo donax TaxID=35708 RepID=A0A0A9CFH3_ARUDO
MDMHVSKAAMLTSQQAVTSFRNTGDNESSPQRQPFLTTMSGNLVALLTFSLTPISASWMADSKAILRLPSDRSSSS